jgi:hypothetical protein
MSQPTPRVTPETWSSITAPGTDDPRACTGPETFSFVDIEHTLLEEAELEAAADAWDGFL